MYNTFKGKENLFSQLGHIFSSYSFVAALYCFLFALPFISPIVPYPRHTSLCKELAVPNYREPGTGYSKDPDMYQNTYCLHTLLAVVKLFPFHFTNPLWLHTFLICPILVPSTFFRCWRITKCQTTFPRMLHFKKHSRYVITSGSQTEGKNKNVILILPQILLYTHEINLLPGKHVQ